MKVGREAVGRAPRGDEARRAQRTDDLRVQRITGDLPVVHLEAEVPTQVSWNVSIRGLVEQPFAVSLSDLRAMPLEERVWDLHCVWGWTAPARRWKGLPASALIDRARPLTSARYVVVGAVETALGSQRPTYASCLTLGEARSGLIALGLDDAPLPPEHGGPLRFVQPPKKWGYKGVKWLATMTLTDEFIPGFWEELVGNPIGDIPRAALTDLDDE